MEYRSYTVGEVAVTIACQFQVYCEGAERFRMRQDARDVMN
jgi:hypothetical protein